MVFFCPKLAAFWSCTTSNMKPETGRFRSSKKLSQDIISDWDQAIESLLTKDPINNWFKCASTECTHSSINKQNVISHIQARHLEGFPGLPCNHCHKLSPTMNALARHVQRAHKEPVNIFGNTNVDDYYLN